MLFWRLPQLKTILLIGLLAAFLGAALIWFIADGLAGLGLPASAPAAPLRQITRAPAERLARPALSANPTLAEQGRQFYWARCLVCHGDQGQGLTSEWRSLLDQVEQLCLLPACDPDVLRPQDLVLLPTARPVMGPEALIRFDNAEQVYRHILEAMPQQSPGALTPAEAWPLTVYLLQANGALPHGVTLTPENAMIALLHRPQPPPRNERPGVILLAAALALTGGILSTKVKDLWSGKRPNFFHHLHPPTVLAVQARWRYTLGAGGLAIFLTLVLVITGALEMFFYIPTPEQAGPSVQTITYLVPYGKLVRHLHYWAAQALVVVTGLHLLRVVFTGAYIRRFNYLLGLILFILTLCLDFTGYMLRWDEGVRWALVAGANLLKTIPWGGNWLYRLVVGGEQPGAATLIRFYTWHIFGLMLALVIIIAWHIFKVRRDGGLVTPPVDQSFTCDRVTRFELVHREVVAMLFAAAGLLLVATFVPAPLAMPMQASLSTLTDNRAPWFFLWVQQLLRWGDPFWLGVLAPAAVLALVGLLPYISPAPRPAELGRWFPRGGRPAQVTLIIVGLGILGLTVLALLAPSS
jgi:cytochrome b-561